MALIHILDARNARVIGTLDSDAGDFTEARVTRSTNQAYTFDFVAHRKTDLLQTMNRIVIKGVGNVWEEYTIRTREDDGGAVYIESDGSFVEDLRKAAPHPPERLLGETPLTALRQALTPSNIWQAGRAEWSGEVRDLTLTDYSDPYEFILKIAEEFGMELRFRVEIRDNYVAGRYVDLLENPEPYMGREIEFGRNLIGVRRMEDSQNLVSALVVVGPDPDEEGAEPIVVTVEDQDARDRWGMDGQHLWAVYKPEMADENPTAFQLSRAGADELKRRINALVQYEVDAISYPDMRIGATIRVKDTHYQPPLYLEAIVREQEEDLIRGDVVSFTLGEFIQYTEEELLAQVREIRDLLKKAAMRTEIEGDLARIYEDLEGREPSIHTGPEPPPYPVLDQKWMDTSQLPHVLKVWNGTAWVKASPTEAWEIGAETPGGAQDKADGAEQDAKDHADGAAQYAEDNAKAYADLKDAEWILEVKNANSDFVQEYANRKISQSATAPATPEVDDLWIDTSQTPHVWKRWDGTAWVNASAVALEDLSGVLDGARIAVRSIEGPKLADLTISSGKILDGAISDVKIAAEAVTEGAVRSGSITTGKLAEKAITSAKLALEAVQAGHIQVAAVTGPAIADFSITDDKVKEIDAGKVQTGVFSDQRLKVGPGSTFVIGYDPTTKETPSGAQEKASAAERAAKTYAEGQASTAEQQAVQKAATDAMTKAEAARDAAIAAAATDATSKAGAAESAAKLYAEDQAGEAKGYAEEQAEGVKAYVRSRAENLVTNGLGTLGDNTNFSRADYDGTTLAIGRGSFTREGRNGGFYIDELIPFDITKPYRLVFYIKTRDGKGTYLPRLNFYDVDGNAMSRYHLAQPGFTRTTLTRDLKAGDTEIHVADASQFRNDDVASHYRVIQFWGYQSESGYTYPNYTRRVYQDRWSPGAVDVENGVIHLDSPWPASFPAYKAGHEVSSAVGGDSYALQDRYISNTTTWQMYDKVFDADSTSTAPGPLNDAIAFVQIAILTDRSLVVGDTERTWLNGVQFYNVEQESRATDNAEVVATEKAGAAESAAKEFATGEAGKAETAAKNYAETTAETARDAAIQSAATDAMQKAEAARDAAISAAATDATQKAGAAETAAKGYAETQAGTAKSEAISAAATDAQQKAAAAQSAAISAAASDAASKAEAAKSAAISAAATDATQKAGAAESAAKTYAEEQVGAIDIGGRNLLALTKLTSRYATFTTDILNGVIQGNGNWYIQTGLTFTPGETYTVSVEEYEAPNGGYYDALRMIIYSPSTDFYAQTIANLKPGGKHTFTANANVNHTPDTQFVFYVSGSDKTDFRIKGLKVEQGNQATAWTPAAEDLEADAASKAETARSQAVETAAADATKKAGAAETAAKSHADSAASSAESAAKGYAETQAGTAKSEAISAAASDAQQKASAAQQAAISAAAQDAASKAEAAKNAAISAASTDATSKAGAAESAAKLYAEEQATLQASEKTFESSHKEFYNFANVHSRSNQNGRYLVIKTNIPMTARMYEIDFKGYNYTENATSIDFSVGFYAYASDRFLQKSFISRGNKKVTDAQLAMDADGKALIIVRSATNNWNYPSIVAERMSVTYQSTPANVEKGWTMQFVDDLATVNANWTGITNVPETILEDTAGAQSKASAAQSAAISTAAQDATKKAGAAESAAISAAATDATSKANTARDAAISTAATDATQKAGAAETAAKSHADTAAGTAKSQAISTAAGDATSKANTARDAAISAASTDATQKAGAAETAAKSHADTAASTAKSQAIDAAATDAKNKADAAQSAAISAAATDATQKAGAAESAAKTYAEKQVEGIEIGGRNLVLKSAEPKDSAAYLVAEYDLAEDWELQTEYTITIKGEINAGQTWGIWANGAGTSVAYVYPRASGISSATFTTPSSIRVTTPKTLRIYSVASSGAQTAHVDWIKLEKGNKATAWSPAPEDLEEYAETTAETKKGEAIEAAATDATKKAGAAETAAKNHADSAASSAETAAKTFATGEAATAKSQAIDAAATDAKNKADAAQSAAISAAATDATSKAGAAESAAKTYAEEQVAAIEVGARNFLRDSSDEKTSTSIINHPIDRDILLSLQGQAVTFSFDVKASVESFRVDAYLRNTNSASIITETWMPQKLIGTEYVRLSHTFTMPSVEAIPVVTLAVRGNHMTGTFTVRNLQLERGNKATDWTPAAEDLQAYAESQASTAKSEAISTASSDATTKAGNAETAAKLHAETVAGTAERNAKTYAETEAAAAAKPALDQISLWKYPGTDNLDGGDLQGNSVTAAKIAAKAITAEKMAANSITAANGAIADLAVGTSHIQNAAITNAKIDAIDAKKITTGQLDAERVVIGPGNTIKNYGYPYYTRITVYGDPNKYYPVVLGGGDQNVKRQLLIKRGYSELHPPEWYSSTHGGGLLLRMTTNFGGWGGQKYGWEIYDYEWQYNETFGGAQNTAHNMGFMIFLRGGGERGAYYHLYSDQYLEGNHTYVGQTPRVLYETDEFVMEHTNTAYNVRNPGPLLEPRRDEIRAHTFMELAEDSDKRIKLWQYADTTFIDGGNLYTNTVTANKIAAGAITAEKIAANSITADMVQANAIGAVAIAAGAVSADAIAGKTITGDKIAADAITADLIAANAIGAAAIAARAISADKIAAGTITAYELAANSVTANQIAALSVHTNALQAKAITAEKMAANSITAANAAIASAAILTANIADAAITNAKIGSLDASKITTGVLAADRVQIGAATTFAAGYDPSGKATVAEAEAAAKAAAAGEIRPLSDRMALWAYADTVYIDGGSIYANSITANQIATGAITADLIAGGQITAALLAANAVQAGKIDTNAVTAGTIAADAVTAREIKAGSITTEHISANSITSSMISTVGLDAGVIKFGTMSGERILTNTIDASKLKAGSIIAGDITFKGVLSGATGTFSGDITTSKDANVGNNLYLGDTNSISSKMIRFRGTASIMSAYGTDDIEISAQNFIVEDGDYTIGNPIGTNNGYIRGRLYFDASTVYTDLNFISGKNIYFGSSRIYGNGSSLYFYNGSNYLRAYPASSTYMYFYTNAGRIVMSGTNLSAEEFRIGTGADMVLSSRYGNNSRYNADLYSYNEVHLRTPNTLIRVDDTVSRLLVRTGDDGLYTDVWAKEFVVMSDRRAKKDFEVFNAPQGSPAALEAVKKTPVWKYRYINQDGTTEKTLGLIADQVPPELKRQDPEGEAINLYAAISLLWKALQDLSGEVETLRGLLPGPSGNTVNDGTLQPSMDLINILNNKKGGTTL